MTSIISPTLAARTQMGLARVALQEASTAVYERTPATEPTPIRTPQLPIRIGIPEHNGPDSPDNPWYLGDRDNGGIGRARAASASALKHLDKAISFGSALRPGVLGHLTRAREDASEGARLIGTRIHPDHIAHRFDSSLMWLNTAISLMDLGQPGRPPVVVRPPITILPVDPPTVQLPGPDAPVQ